MKDYLKNKIAILGMTMLTTLSFVINFAITEDSNGHDLNSIAGVLYKLGASVKGTGVLSAFLFLVIYKIYKKYYEYIKSERKVLLRVLSFILSIGMVVGLSMMNTNSLCLLYTEGVQKIKTVIMLGGYYYFYLYITTIVYGRISGKVTKTLVIPAYIHTLGDKIFEGNIFKKTVYILSAIWIPQMIIKYPGAMCADSYYQLEQYFGQTTFTSHHPPFHTVLMGIFVGIGKELGSFNIGLFLFVIVQNIYFILVLSYSLLLMRQWKLKKCYCVLVLAMYCFAPIFSGYASVVLKDTMYCISYLWYICCIITMIRTGENCLKDYKNVAMFVTSSTLVCLFRNNGIYIVIPMTMAIIVYSFALFKKNAKVRRRIVMCSFVPIILYFIINGFLFHHYNIEKGSKREMLSIPFQQTARYIRDYGEEITKEERTVINHILDYEKISKEYNPILADPVKDTYREGATKRELMEYFKVWKEHFKKHPLVYIEATINTNYSLLCPAVDNISYYKDVYAGKYAKGNGVSSTPNVLEKLQLVLVSYYKAMNLLPVFNTLLNMSVYVIAMLCMFVYILKDHRFKQVLILIPNILTFAICIASPAILNHPRYVFPIVYTMPIIVVAYIVKEKKDIGGVQ